MQIGALTAHGDVAEMVLATFVVFFVSLIIYLQRESNREGFPLLDQTGSPIASTGLSGVPAAKFFLLPDGNVITAPRAEPIETVPAESLGAFPGAPLEIIGNRLTSGLGPAAYARRADVPVGQLIDGGPRIVPLAADPAYGLDPEGPDPRGAIVLGADGVVAGTVHDAWVDRSETMLRYLEVTLSTEWGGRHVLVPATMVDVKPGIVLVESILAAQFADVPATKSMTQITMLEEDMIMAYYGAGTLYATAARSEPLL